MLNDASEPSTAAKHVTIEIVMLRLVSTITHVQHVLISFGIEVSSCLELRVRVRGAKDLWMTLDLKATVEVRRLLGSDLGRRSQMVLASVQVRVLIGWLVKRSTMTVAPSFVALLTSLASWTLWRNSYSLGRGMRMMMAWRWHLVSAVSVLHIDLIQGEIVSDVIEDHLISIHDALRWGT